MQPGVNDDCRIHVLVADNSPFQTQLLVGALKRHSDLEVSSSALDSTALRAFLYNHPIDVLVISSFIETDAQHGLEMVRELREISPNARVVLLINASGRDAILEAFRAGAKGVFNIQEPTDALYECICRIHKGEMWVSPEQFTLLLESIALTPNIKAVDSRGLNLLSKREEEVVRYLAEGLTNREIARRIGLSQHTVKNYLFRIFEKLGVSNRMELVAMTLSQGAAPLQALLIDPTENYDDATLSSCRKAAQHGVVAAQLALARMLSLGRKKDRDPQEAYIWLSLATAQIADSIDSLKQSMSASQLAAAEREARKRLDQAGSDENGRLPEVNLESRTAASGPV